MKQIIAFLSLIVGIQPVWAGYQCQTAPGVTPVYALTLYQQKASAGYGVILKSVDRKLGFKATLISTEDSGLFMRSVFQLHRKMSDPVTLTVVSKVSVGRGGCGRGSCANSSNRSVQAVLQYSEQEVHFYCVQTMD